MGSSCFKLLCRLLRVSKDLLKLKLEGPPVGREDTETGWAALTSAELGQAWPPSPPLASLQGGPS